MPDDATKARRRAVQERLYTWIVTALDNNEYETYVVSMNKSYPLARATTFPLVTLSLSNSPYITEVYNRAYPNKGVTVEYPFTLFIYHLWNRNDTRYSHNYDVQILTDLIIKYLRSRNWDHTIEKDLHGIIRVEDLQSRESDPRGVRNLTRMIVNGIIVAIREDSP